MIDSATNLAKSIASAVKFLQSLVCKDKVALSAAENSSRDLGRETATPIAAFDNRCGFLNLVSLNYFATGPLGAGQMRKDGRE